METRFPRPLSRGDAVAVVTPASGVRDADALDRGLARLREQGLEPVVMPHGRKRLSWPEGCAVAATDAERLEDLHAAISDPRYRAVLCARGGYGSARLLDGLDLSPLLRDPKPLVGYSDITALLAAAHADTGLVGFHGPMVATSRAMDAGEAGWRLQHELLHSTNRAPALPDAPTTHGLRPGVAEGPLVGGNLCLVQSLVGTRWAVRTHGAILFLEEIGEEPYRVDRMLTHLIQAGAFEGVVGVVLGDFHVEKTPLGSQQPGMIAVLEERLSGLDVPVARGFPVGHMPGSWTLPYGARARLEVPRPGARASLTLLEPAVRA